MAFAENNAFMKGGEGAVTLAEEVVRLIKDNPSKPLTYAYDLNDSVPVKIEKIAKKLYGASNVIYHQVANNKLKLISDLGYSGFPVCIAKTQYSFSDDSTKYGVPEDFELTVRNFVINAGAEMIIAIAGDIMRMPGLPREPQARNIDVVNGEIVGLS